MVELSYSVMGLRSVGVSPIASGGLCHACSNRLFTLIVADVNMSEVISYLRHFRSSVATGPSGSSELESAPILRRLDAFLSSHLVRCTRCYVCEVGSSTREGSVSCSLRFHTIALSGGGGAVRVLVFGGDVRCWAL